MQLSSKEHFKPIAFQKLKDWRLEKSCMKDHTCLLDHHQRSLWNTITIGLKGMINWVLQLNNRELGNSFNSLLEKHHVLNSPKPTQSKPKPICDRSGKPEDIERVCVEKGKTSPSQEIDDKRLQEELGSSDRTGKPVKSEDTRVMHATRWNRRTCEIKCKHTLSERRICSCRTSWHCIIQREQRVQPCNRRGEHRLQYSWWNDHMASTFATWFRRSRTTLSDKHFKVTFNNIEHSTLSEKNHKMRSKLLGTLNYAR